MKRILVIVLAGAMAAVFISTDAFAGNRKGRHFKRYRGNGHYIGQRRSRLYRRYRQGYRPFSSPFFFYNCINCGGYYQRHDHHGHYHPGYSRSSTTVYSSGTTYSSVANGGQVLGAILGGIGGGVIGNQIGGGRGKAVATVAGSLIGLLVGGEIGRQLDDRERLIMARTTTKTLEAAPSGTVVPWRDPDSGTHGSVTPKPAYQNAQGDYCREYQQSITIGGKSKSAYGTACRNADGSWRFVPTR